MMPENNDRNSRRFTLNEDRAREWLRQVATATDETRCPGQNGIPVFMAELEEIDEQWNPRDLGNEDDVYNLIRAAIDDGIIHAPTLAPTDSTRCDLDFLYVDDSDGGTYCFIVRLGLSLKLATPFESPRSLGDWDAIGADAAISILREAVTSANAVLSELDHGIASRRHHVPRADDLIIGSFLDLSTAHLDKSTCEALNSFGQVIADKTPYGWWMHVSDFPEEDPTDGEWPDELHGIVRLARRHGCRYVLFDCDAPTTELLPIFDW